MRAVFWYGSLARAKAEASCRYRIGNLAEAGQGASVVIAPELPRDLLSSIDVLLILRPYPSAAVHEALRECGRRGILRIADYDDLLFAGSPAQRPEVTSGRLSLAWAEDAQRAYASLLPSFDAFTVATVELAEELRMARPNARVFVVPNGLSATWVGQGRAMYRGWRPGDRRVARFFPGSPTHDDSFDSIRAPLDRWLRAHDDAELEVVGNLSWDPGRFPAGRARHCAPRPFDHLPELLASAWVNVWPRADTRFNRCKSPIKFLEAAAFGCPTICAPACVRPEIVCDGLVATEDWYATLNHLRDDTVRARASDAARGHADERGSARRGWTAFAEAIEALR